jgi:VIT1/CCC1 family predicted Fe2+/Mn2+ transporter
MTPSGADHVDKPRRVLEPEERVAEVLFGLIMVVTFTGSLSVAEAGRDDVRAMIIGAFGCNLAWGVIDGVLYSMGCLADRGRRVQALRALKRAGDARSAERILKNALPPLVASVLEPAELAALCQRLVALPDPPPVARLTRKDALGACGVFLLVFLSTLPVAVPFVLVHDIPRAMRVSNAIALVMLLVTGAAYGRIVGRSVLGFGIGMVLLGLMLVGLTIALGG